jgi:UDP-N-acetylmuramoyl-L-alanyl-D-glutamate--2,6-diaminopimelate ligase
VSAAVADGTDVAALLARLGAPVRRVTSDSRDVQPGDTFAAYPGGRRDGRTYIANAIARGAGSVLFDPRDFAWNEAWKLPHLPVGDLKGRLGYIGDVVYGHPSRAMWIVGVTGTNGKTSCAHWVAAGLEAAGRPAALMGTLGNGLLASLQPATNTTPDAALLQETLAKMRAAGAQTVAMEVSSHGIDQGRVNGVTFAVALFTNLSRDHLDYHGTMDAYGAAKARLFSWPGLGVGVINGDDTFGKTMIDDARAKGVTVLSYGFGAADVAGSHLVASPRGLDFTVTTPWGVGQIRARVVGAFNASNLLGVLAVLLVSGVELDRALAFLGQAEAPPGRMQRLGGNGHVPLVVIDYAHTPDALEKVLAALRPAVGANGKLICVFGCGGDRDRGKRPEMGRVAARLADRIFVTNDNPRSEDPAGIARDIVQGIRDGAHPRYVVELDRAKAIASAIAEAHAADVVLLAGKGHEATQEQAGIKTAFLDADHATRALALRSWG